MAKAIATSQTPKNKVNQCITSEQVLFARAAVSISVEMFDDWIYNSFVIPILFGWF